MAFDDLVFKLIHTFCGSGFQLTVDILTVKLREKNEGKLSKGKCKRMEGKWIHRIKEYTET